MPASAAPALFDDFSAETPALGLTLLINFAVTGNSLYGVRFLADRAFAATFRRVDPLYAFDLSNPADPRIAGSLELPGFSDLLHPVTANLLLGVGQSENGGVRVALFDVSRLEQPREVGGFAYGAVATSSEARADRHAFAYLPDVDVIDHLAFRSISSRRTGSTGSSARRCSYSRSATRACRPAPC